jgi:hypothetical protein
MGREPRKNRRANRHWCRSDSCRRMRVWRKSWVGIIWWYYTARKFSTKEKGKSSSQWPIWRVLCLPENWPVLLSVPHSIIIGWCSPWETWLHTNIVMDIRAIGQLFSLHQEAPFMATISTLIPQCIPAKCCTKTSKYMNEMNLDWCLINIINMVVLTFNWTFERGKAYRTINFSLLPASTYWVNNATIIVFHIKIFPKNSNWIHIDTKSKMERE